MRKLLAVAALLATLPASALPVSAAVMQATFWGTVTSGTDENANVFGIAELTGQTFSLSFTYDTKTTGIISYTSPNQDFMYGGNDYLIPDPLLSAILTINGQSYISNGNWLTTAEHYYYGNSAGYAQFSAVEVSSSNNHYITSRLEAGFGSSILGSLFTSLERSLSLTAQPGQGGAGAFIINGCTYTVSPCDLGTHMYAMGTLSVDRFTVSQVGIPAALPLLLSGLATLGIAGRWRRSRRAVDPLSA